jgi:hypothetical protein
MEVERRLGDISATPWQIGATMGDNVSIVLNCRSLWRGRGMLLFPSCEHEAERDDKGGDRSDK